MTTSFAVAHRPASTSNAVASAIVQAGAIAATAFAWIAAARMRRRTMRVLTGLSDHDLKDIGLARNDIAAVERHPRYSPYYTRY